MPPHFLQIHGWCRTMDLSLQCLEWPVHLWMCDWRQYACDITTSMCA